MTQFEISFKGILDKYDKEDKYILTDELNRLIENEFYNYSLKQQIQVLLGRPLTDDEATKVDIMSKSGGVTAI